MHPNDHVNMAQSTNDVIPTVIRVAAARQVVACCRRWTPWPGRWVQGAGVRRRAQVGRTHLQDAVPVRLGQSSRLPRAVALDREASLRRPGCPRLGIGGTATGTGLNSHPEYHARMVARISALSGEAFTCSGNLFESMQSTADC